MKSISARISVALAGLLLAIVFVVLWATPGKLRAQTVYNQPANALAQILGGPGAAVYQPTYAATMTIDVVAGGLGNAVCQINGVSTVSSTSTVNVGSKGQFGQVLFTIVSASASGTVTITFGTNFLPTATAAPTASKSITVLWVSDGTVWHEVARAAAE